MTQESEITFGQNTNPEYIQSDSSQVIDDNRGETSWLPTSLKLIGGYNSEIDVKPIDQKTGLGLFESFFKDQLLITKIPPIYISKLIRNEQTHSALIHFGRGQIISINSVALDAYDKYGKLLFLPKQDATSRYKWLDVYAVENDTVVNLSNLLQRLRINEKKKRIEARAHFDPDLQLFLDYVYGDIDVDNPNDLNPFKARVNQSGQIHLMKNRPKKARVIPAHSLAQKYSEILLVPKYDTQRRYVYIEGYDINDQEKRNLILTRRIQLNKFNKEDSKIVEWGGPEIQALIDWMHVKLPIKDTEEVKIYPGKSSAIYLESSKLKIQLSSNGALDRTQPVYIIPRENDVYRWLAVEQEDTYAHKRRLISRWLVEFSNEEPFLKGGWIGPEKQALVDYIEDKIDSSQLEVITAQVDSSRHVYITRNIQGSKPLIISLRTKYFQIGDIVSLNPKVRENDDLIVEISKADGNEVLGIATYNKETKSFISRTLIMNSEQQESIIPPEETNEYFKKLLGEGK